MTTEKGGRKYVEMVGLVFGRLTVISISSERRCGIVVWECRCSCGNTDIILAKGSDLRKGNTQSCGCLQKERIRLKYKKYNEYDLESENYGIGYTFKGQEFYFDKEDYDLIKEYCWLMKKEGYILTTLPRDEDRKRIELKLHRLILNLEYKDELVVDHINGNKMDNRKINLRICSQQENNMNHRNIRKTNKTGVTGVQLLKNKKYLVALGIGGKVINLGTYKNFDDAVRARLLAEREYFKEFSPQQHLFAEYGIPPLD